MSEPKVLKCPKCGTPVHLYRNPLLTVDVIIELPEGIVLIERKNPPYGWALPGGFVDYGEDLETAARREAKEETGLDLKCLRQFRAYSDPGRDPRHHTVTMVFTAMGEGIPEACDDAMHLKVFPLDELPGQLAFDHGEILREYVESVSHGKLEKPHNSL